jgi:hypothetical protein
MCIVGSDLVNYSLCEGIGSALALLNFKMGIFHIDQYTAPGYFSALLAVGNACLIIFMFKDIRDLKRSSTLRGYVCVCVYMFYHSY